MSIFPLSTVLQNFSRASWIWGVCWASWVPSFDLIYIPHLLALLCKSKVYKMRPIQWQGTEGREAEDEWV